MDICQITTFLGQLFNKISLSDIQDTFNSISLTVIKQTEIKS